MLLTATILRLLALPTILLFLQLMSAAASDSGASDPEDTCIGDDCLEVAEKAWGMVERNPRNTGGILLIGGIAVAWYKWKSIVNLGSRGLNGLKGIFGFKVASTVAPPLEAEDPLPAPEERDFGDNLLELLENHWMWLIVLAVGLVCCCCCATLVRYLWRRSRYRMKKDLKHRPNRYYEREERKEWLWPGHTTTTSTITPSTGPNVIFGMGPSTPPGDFDGSQRRASTRSTRQAGQQQQQQRPQSASPFGVPGNVQGNVTPAQPGAFGQPQNQHMSASGRFPQANQGFQPAQSGFQQQQQAPPRPPVTPSPQQPAGYQNQFQRGPPMAQQRPPPPANFPGQPRAPFGQQQPQRPPPAQNHPPQQQYYRR